MVLLLSIYIVISYVQFLLRLAEVLRSCPEKDTSCRIEDGSNVLNVFSTNSDGECGCESKVSRVQGVSMAYNFSKIHQKFRKLETPLQRDE